MTVKPKGGVELPKGVYLRLITSHATRIFFAKRSGNSYAGPCECMGLRVGTAALGASIYPLLVVSLCVRCGVQGNLALIHGALWIPNDISKALLERLRALGLAQRNLSTDPHSSRAARGCRSTFRARQSLQGPNETPRKKKQSFASFIQG